MTFAARTGGLRVESDESCRQSAGAQLRTSLGEVSTTTDTSVWDASAVLLIGLVDPPLLRDIQRSSEFQELLNAFRTRLRGR
jgi:hypothetical protein